MFPDVFKPDLFTTTALVAAINAQPFLPGRLGELGLFTESGVETTSVAVESIAGVLTLVATSKRGAVGQTRMDDKRRGVQLAVPHLQVNDALYADSIQNVRAFGSPDTLVAQQAKRDEKLGAMSRDLDYTLEYHRMGALQGKVLDADGSTVLYNLFTTFNIAEPTEIDFDLDNASPAVGAVKRKCTQVIRAIAVALGNIPFTGVHALCGDAFFDDLISHPETQKLFEIQQSADVLRENSAYQTFQYGGIVFENYRGHGPVAIGTDKCRFFPTGVPDLFKTIFAPADYLETVNTIGLPRYAKAAPMKFDKGLELEAQSNPLNICTRPGVLQSARRT